MAGTIAGAACADDQLSALTAFAGALRRESHVLREHPELLWQQFYNRLQWARPPLAERLVDERERRSLPGARPWIHRCARLRESDALVRTLGGRTDMVWSCAVSPDGRWIVSDCDGPLKIWDAASGAEQITIFTGHTHGVNACTVSPDGRWRRAPRPPRRHRHWAAPGHCGSVRRRSTGALPHVSRCLSDRARPPGHRDVLPTT